MRLGKILVPIDFSDASRAALAEAAELAGAPTRLTLLHVHPITAVAVLDVTYVEPPEHLAAALARADEQLRAWAKESCPSATIEVATGEPLQEILRRSEHYDLIVIGPHGKSGWSRFLLGSVTERVVRGAHCSVLVVRPRADRQPSILRTT